MVSHMMLWQEERIKIFSISWEQAKLPLLLKLVKLTDKLLYQSQHPRYPQELHHLDTVVEQKFQAPLQQQIKHRLLL